MLKGSDQIKEILIERLEKRGVEPDVIPSFIRSLANTLLVNPQLDVLRINKQMHSLGWDGFDVDDHTLQLALACFEAEGLQSLEKKPAKWYEKTFKRKREKTP